MCHTGNRPSSPRTRRSSSDLASNRTRRRTQVIPRTQKHTSRGAPLGGRRLIELNLRGDGDGDGAPTRRVSGLRVIDWFRDDSFYIVEAPDIASEHAMGLAPIAQDKFVLLGGGELRPNPLVPLPESESIVPDPFGLPDSLLMTPGPPCPGSVFGADRQIWPRLGGPVLNHAVFCGRSVHAGRRCVAYRAKQEAVWALDASPDVLVVSAHDSSLCGDVLGFFPHPRAESAVWYKDGDRDRDGQRSRKEIGRWRFRSGGIFGSNITLCYQVSGYNGASISQIDGMGIG
ncbi:hypothetical protein BC826DRAFT_118151 [Russula brevipes]|nr:hypothetical protein BC826DRAFT_118151 [Russula brevipes]